ncbi:MAG: 5'/3'-nucleotidase SurE [Bacilli bacterium]|nr:5'/3'-nucleotidase SurE [Bacilli bacterium]MDD3069319.1 5'/3'-nucleotidase SurE [Bacilli bacterium]MDD3841687.1 5'/3'-nucleotidase SurE [Bacilli bacterium]HKM10475.1 5'/3'-nucleotidase SurE [Bacilli bacterium]
MNILLTNDDGYSSIGIQLMKKLLLPYGRVVIVAPKEGMSAKSCSITLGRPIQIEEINPDVFTCSGTPADCVSFALSSLNIDFDLVVSGINHGNNVSYDTMYSGTVGACLEALIFKKPTFAISTEDNFALVEQHFSRVWDFINNRNLLSGEYLLNINFPLGDEVKGIALGKLHYRRDKNYFIKKEDGYYAFRYMEDIADAPQNTDLYQVNHDIISIVPLNNSYFSTELFDKLNNK